MDIPPLAQIRPPEYGAPNYHPLPFTVSINLIFAFFVVVVFLLISYGSKIR
jgi:hypothetical protein